MTLSFHIHLSQVTYIFTYILIDEYSNMLTLSLLYGYSTPLFHVLVSLLHEHSSILDNTISYRHWLYWTLLFHVFESLITLIRYICTFGTCITVTRVLYSVITYTCHMDSPVYMLWLFYIFLLQWITVLVTWIFLYSCFMTISCNPDMILLLLNMWAVDMWCVN